MEFKSQLVTLFVHKIIHVHHFTLTPVSYYSSSKESHVKPDKKKNEQTGNTDQYNILVQLENNVSRSHGSFWQI